MINIRKKYVRRASKWCVSYTELKNKKEIRIVEWFREREEADKRYKELNENPQ